MLRVASTSTSSACQDCRLRCGRAGCIEVRCAPVPRPTGAARVWKSWARRDCVCVCDCVVPPCLLRRRSLTAAPSLCCAVAAVAAGFTVPAPAPLTTSPPAPTPVPIALLCPALRCCAWRQDGPASSRAFATEWLCWSIDARASSRTGACLEWAFAAASACPPVRPSSTTASAEESPARVVER